jgi:hypothetical protein
MGWLVATMPLVLMTTERPGNWKSRMAIRSFGKFRAVKSSGRLGKVRGLRRTGPGRQAHRERPAHSPRDGAHGRLALEIMLKG